MKNTAEYVFKMAEKGKNSSLRAGVAVETNPPTTNPPVNNTPNTGDGSDDNNDDNNNDGGAKRWQDMNCQEFAQFWHGMNNNTRQMWSMSLRSDDGDENENGRSSADIADDLARNCRNEIEEAE